MNQEDFLQLSADDRSLYFSGTYIRIMPTDILNRRVKNTIIPFEQYKDEYILNFEKLKPAWFWYEGLPFYAFYFPRRTAKRGYCDLNVHFISLNHIGIGNLLLLLRAWEKKEQQESPKFKFLSDSLLLDKVTRLVYFKLREFPVSALPDHLLKGK